MMMIERHMLNVVLGPEVLRIVSSKKDGVF